MQRAWCGAQRLWQGARIHGPASKRARSREHWAYYAGNITVCRIWKYGLHRLHVLRHVSQYRLNTWAAELYDFDRQA
jgi:hypothetical protein